MERCCKVFAKDGMYSAWGHGLGEYVRQDLDEVSW